MTTIWLQYILLAIVLTLCWVYIFRRLWKVFRRRDGSCQCCEGCSCSKKEMKNLAEKK